MKLGILTSFHDSPKEFVNACKELNVEYEIIDFISADWLNNIRKSNVDGLLCHPSCDYQERKSIIDERLFFVDKYLKIPIYPNFISLYIYENKRNMSYWLDIHDIPHAKTSVITSKLEAKKYFENAEYPIVLKSNIGAGGSMVNIIQTKRNSTKYINKIFGYRNGLFCKGLSPVFKKFGFPFKFTGSAQKHYMILQDFHKIKWEWRIIKIGNNYSGHKKLLKGNKASGSGLVGWEEPPVKLLYFVRDICDRGNFDSMAVDIFETENEEFLVNELQALFGSYLPYQMKINGVKGIYEYSEEFGFKFKEGEFHKYKSNLLRVEDFIRKLSI